LSLCENNGFLTSVGRVYQLLLFDKQDQSNISQSELAWFRSLAKTYEGLNEAKIQRMLELREFVEIHHDQEI
jgi:hypothetical protein